MQNQEVTATFASTVFREAAPENALSLPPRLKAAPLVGRVEVRQESTWGEFDPAQAGRMQCYLPSQETPPSRRRDVAVRPIRKNPTGYDKL